MSENVRYKGSLKEIKPNHNESLKELMKRVVISLGEYPERIKTLENFEDYLLWEKYYEKYFVINNKLYKVINNTECFDSDEEKLIAIVKADGSIDFDVQYYNGGCGLSEAIEEATNEYIKKHTPKIRTLEDKKWLMYNFNQLTNDKERWIWISEHQDCNIVIMLDNDDTYGVFEDHDYDGSDQSFVLQFDWYIGCKDGVFELLKAMNIKCDGV